MTPHLKNQAQTKMVSLPITEGFAELLSLCSDKEHADKATILRRWLYRGAERDVLKLIAEGEISRGYAAEKLGLSAWDIICLAQEYGIEIGPTPEQIEESSKWGAWVVEKLKSERNHPV